MMEKVNTKDKKSQKTKFYFSLLTSHFLPKKAQTAMELAVFGAILIFVVGAIVRQALSAGYMQNQQLRAMRQAMTTSYRYSTGLAGGGGGSGDASHQTASVLFVEDRLTAESAKYAAIDRTPYVASAAATYSRNLFLPVDAGEDYNLPIYDIFINGKRVEGPVINKIYYYNRGDYGQEGQVIKVPEGHVYVLGDNSASSHDSRFWGFVQPERGKKNHCTA